MDISSLKCFIVVAEHLNFSEAANRLFITQSTVSRRIASLENELGVRLFERKANGVSLTEAGSACLPDIREIVRRLEAMQEKTLRFGDGREGILRIACDGEHDRELVASACAEMRKIHPGIAIQIMRGCSGPAVEQLINEEADAILAITSELYDVKGLVEIPIKPMCWTLVMPREHPLADKKQLSVEDLKRQTIIAFERSIAPRAYDAVMKACMENGFMPNYALFENNKEDMLLSMISRNGIAVMASGCAEGLPDSFATRSIYGIDASVDYALAYMKGNVNPSLPLFVDLLTKIAGTQGNKKRRTS